MSTINVSLPEPLREYVEERAESGSYSSSEYIRQLIREDRDRYAEQQQDRLWQLLAIREQQAEAGDFVESSVETIMARGRARRASATSYWADIVCSARPRLTLRRLRITRSEFGGLGRASAIFERCL